MRRYVVVISVLLMVFCMVTIVIAPNVDLPLTTLRGQTAVRTQLAVAAVALAIHVISALLGIGPIPTDVSIFLPHRSHTRSTAALLTTLCTLLC